MTLTKELWVSEQFVVIVEAGLSRSSYGVDVHVSDPMTQNDADVLAREIAAGGRPVFGGVAREALVVQAGDGSYLAVEKRRFQPLRLARVTVCRVLGRD